MSFQNETFPRIICNKFKGFSDMKLHPKVANQREIEDWFNPRRGEFGEWGQRVRNFCLLVCLSHAFGLVFVCSENVGFKGSGELPVSSRFRQ